MPNGSSESSSPEKGRAPVERIAHRGVSSEAPENTVPAIEIAIQKYHVDRVEVDLRLTKDKVPVVFHDVSVERMTNGAGPVRSHTLEKLKKLDAGFFFDPQGKGQFPFRRKGVSIPTLEELLGAFPDTRFCLEVKERNKEAAEPIFKVLQRVKHQAPLVIGSFHGEIVRELRRVLRPPLPSFLSKDEALRAYLLYRLGFKKFSTEARFASLPLREGKIQLDERRWIEFLHTNGLKVFYWTVNEESQMQDLIQKGADGLMTDYPGRLNQLLSRNS